MRYTYISPLLWGMGFVSFVLAPQKPLKDTNQGDLRHEEPTAQ